MRAGFHSTRSASISSAPSVAPDIRNLADREVSRLLARGPARDHSEVGVPKPIGEFGLFEGLRGVEAVRAHRDGTGGHFAIAANTQER